MAYRVVWSDWVRNLTHYEPTIDNQNDIGNALKTFEELLLSDITCVHVTRANLNWSEITSKDCDHDELVGELSSVHRLEDGLEMFFIQKRPLEKSPNPSACSGQTRLEISTEDFCLLMSRCGVTASFLAALSRPYLPPTKGFRCFEAGFEMWYILPIRVQVKCSDTYQGHSASTAGKNQMNPVNYLHLPEPGFKKTGEMREPLDIRSSHLAVFARHNTESGSMTLLSVNLVDGRWAGISLEPIHRIEETLRLYSHSGHSRNPDSIHLVMFSSVSKWWTNALQAVYEQLIQYEKELQKEMDSGSKDPSEAYTTISQALHAMAAHLHRYYSELEAILTISAFIKETVMNEASTRDNLEHIRTQVNSALTFSQELERKISNTLALLFNRIQIDHNRRMIVTSDAMHQLMLYQREETEFVRQISARSQQLAEETRKDSVSMKTIALMTLFFLPSTSFAALLSMPFFSQTTYLTEETTAWIWAVITVPTTLVAYIFYHMWRKREAKLSNGVEINFRL